MYEIPLFSVSQIRKDVEEKLQVLTIQLYGSDLETKEIIENIQWDFESFSVIQDLIGMVVSSWGKQQTQEQVLKVWNYTHHRIGPWYGEDEEEYHIVQAIVFNNYLRLAAHAEILRHHDNVILHTNDALVVIVHGHQSKLYQAIRH